MAGTLPAPPPFRVDPLAQAGMLGARHLLSRRATREEWTPAGAPAGPCHFRSEQFGFSAYLPHGWTRECGDAYLVPGYGLVRFQDLEVLTPAGAHVRIGSTIEPVRPAQGALDVLVRLYVRSTGGRLVTSAPREGARRMDLTIVLPSEDLLHCVVGVDGKRVLTVETLHAADSETDDAAMRAVHRGFELLEDPDGNEASFISGTYRIR